jgi:hypothetical protein
MQGSMLTDSGRAKSTKEGAFTKAIERQTAKLPSSFFLAVAAGAVALSLGLAVSKKKKTWANFVGQWVPTILILGLYDKIVKTQGSERNEKSSILH